MLLVAASLTGCEKPAELPTRTQLIESYEAETRELERAHKERTAANAIYDQMLQDAEQELADHRSTYNHRYENDDKVSLKDAEATWIRHLKIFDEKKAEIEANRAAAMEAMDRKVTAQATRTEAARIAKDATQP